MLRSLLRFTGALAFAALIVAPSAPFAAPAPGVAYDEIVRVLVNATPAPPGSFQTDLAALNNASVAEASPTPAPKRRGLSFGQIAGIALGGGDPGSIAGNVASDAVGNALENSLDRSLGAQFATLGNSLRAFLSPHLMRYAYYNGWERVEDVTAQTATIRKCDIGQVVQLDLAKRTYSIYDPANEPPPAAAAPSQPRRSGPPPTAPPPQPPGTAVAEFSATTRALGPARIENLATNGYVSTASFAMTQATGSCRNANASISTTEYLSALNRPSVTSCPVRRPPVPESASDVATPPQPTGGCRPTMSFHTAGPPVPSGKLSMYSLVTMNAGAGATPAPAASGGLGIGFLTERGNVRALGAANAALFDIPAGFTKTP